MFYPIKSYANLLLTEREGRTGEYWPEVVAVQKRPRANIPQYDPEQVKLVSSLLHGITFYAQQHFQLFIRVNFRHDVREFPAYDDASSKNPEELKRQHFAFRTRFLAFDFMLLCFRGLNFPGAE